MPFFGFITYSRKFFFIPLIEGVFFEIGILSCKELRKILYSIVLKNITEIVYVICQANLFDFVQRQRKSKINHKGSDSKVFTIFNIYSFFGNIHPSSIFTPVIQDIEIFEPIKLQLSVFC
jgi:hypothetical protein